MIVNSKMMEAFRPWFLTALIIQQSSIFVMSQQPCEDSSTFTFGSYHYNGSVVIKNCSWLLGSTDDRNLKRQNRWCNEIYNGVIIKKKCRFACSLCDVPSNNPSDIPTPSPPTSIESTSTSISQQPTMSSAFGPSSPTSVSPTLTPTAKPTLHPTSEPTLYPTSKPSKLHSSNPSSQPSNQPTLPPTKAPTSKPTKSMHPTMFPSPFPSSIPSSYPFENPSYNPSFTPTKVPSPSPSSPPSYSLQNIGEFYIFMDFFPLNPFYEDGPIRALQSVTDNVIKEVLEENYAGSYFFVNSKLKSFPPIGTLSGDGVANNKRSLIEYNMEKFERTLGDDSNPDELRVSLIAEIAVRSQRKFLPMDLIIDIMDAFNSEEKRYAFIVALQSADVKAFGSISAMSRIKVNDEELIIPSQYSSSALTYIGVGAGIGVAAILFFVAGFGLMKKRKNANNSSLSFDRRYYRSSTDPRISSMIEVDDSGEISTLGDPSVPMFPISNPNTTLRRSEPNVGNIDYQGMYSNIEDTPSISTTTNSEIHEVDDEVIIEVVAPPGSLGVVVGTITGVPAIHAIKDTSKIIDEVQIGDRLISVDGEDTTQMSAIRVSNLIGSKASNAKRILVFKRSLNHFRR